MLSFSKKSVLEWLWEDIFDGSFPWTLGVGLWFRVGGGSDVGFCEGTHKFHRGGAEYAERWGGRCIFSGREMRDGR